VTDCWGTLLFCGEILVGVASEAAAIAASFDSGCGLVAYRRSIRPGLVTVSLVASRFLVDRIHLLPRHTPPTGTDAPPASPVRRIQLRSVTGQDSLERLAVMLAGGEWGGIDFSTIRP